jgi:hypothetical protein
VVGPVAPSTLTDASRLPTAVPWRPGDPVREVPEGAVAAPFSPVSGDLAPGTYRVELSFAVGTAPEVARTAYSAPFVVQS